MRHTFLRHHSGSSELLLFFSGWGSEPGMFISGSDTGPGRDILMLWDYRDMTLDPDLLRGYGRISLLAWSMGVWAAGKALGEADMVNGPRLAVNGTPFPIDDGRGIPTAIFDGTLNGLSERTLAKFRRRMCGSSETLESLLACGLCRHRRQSQEHCFKSFKMGQGCRRRPGHDIPSRRSAPSLGRIERTDNRHRCSTLRCRPVQAAAV